MVLSIPESVIITVSRVGCMPIWRQAPTALLPECGLEMILQQKVTVWFPEEIMDIGNGDITDVLCSRMWNEFTLMLILKFHIVFHSHIPLLVVLQVFTC